MWTAGDEANVETHKKSHVARLRGLAGRVAQGHAPPLAHSAASLPFPPPTLTGE